MNWYYKIANKFKDRNIINYKIKFLSKFKENIDKSSKMVFQSSSNAQKSILDVINSKEITSFPILRDIAIEANMVVHDSPWKFAQICKDLSDIIQDNIIALKEEREAMFKNKKTENNYKGWV